MKVKRNNITTNKITLLLVIINVLVITIAYFGLLDPSGMYNKVSGTLIYAEGTPIEYWKTNLDTYYGIIYTILIVINLFFIVFYRGKGEIIRNITGTLKIQLLLCLLLSIGIYTLSSTITKNGIDQILRVNIYFILIPVLSAILINIKQIKNIKLIAISSLACIAITLMLCLQVNLLIASIINRVNDATLQFTKNGTQLYKNKVNLLSVERIPDGVASLERSSKNYTDFLAILHYPSINKTTNSEIFDIVDKFSKNYAIKNESYLKEKIGDKADFTKLHINGKFAKLRDEDVSLLNTYKTKGIDEAMKELKTTKSSLIGILIEKKNEFDQREIQENNKIQNIKE
jgi:hypothetical protein